MTNNAEQKLILGMQLIYNDFREVCAMPAEIYAQENRNGSIGSHMRHILEFIQIIAEQCEDGVIDYESRARNSVYEQDPKAAELAFKEAIKSLSVALTDQGAQMQLSVREMPAFGEKQIEVPSSLGREVLYAIEHSIHHFALISVIAAGHGIRFSNGFGRAPATREYEARQLDDAKRAQKVA